MELKIAGSSWLPFVRIIWKKVNEKNFTILDEESLMGNIINTLSKKLQFNYTFIEASCWGIKDQSAKELKFNGMVGMLQNDEVDLALGPFVIARGDRYLVADPSSIIMKDDTSGILSSDESIVPKSTVGVLPLTKSFESIVWYLVILTLLMIILLSSVYYIWSKRSDETSLMNEKNFTKVLMKNCFENLRNLIRQCSHSNSRNLPEILEYCWKLSSFLLILFYSSMILVHLIASNKRSINTYEDLANADVMTTICFGTTNELTIREGKIDAIKTIYSKRMKHGLKNCVVSEKRLLSDEIVENVLSGKRVLINSLSTIKSILYERTKNDKQCGFYISELETDYEPHFMLFNKKFNNTLKEKIDFILLEIFERKPFDWKIGKYYLGYKGCLNKQNNSKWKSLILSNIQGLFLVCVVIITLAFIVLFIEKFIHLFRLKYEM